MANPTVLSKGIPFIIATLLLVFVISCKDKNEDPISNPVEVDDGLFHFLALGDSYTIGQGVEVAGRWPVQLMERLKGKGYEMGDLRIIAQTGWTGSDLLNELNGMELEKYDLLSLLIGVNNQFKNQPFSYFQFEFEELLTKAFTATTSDNRIFVVSIPDYGVTPFAGVNGEFIAEEIDMYNAYIKNECEARNIPFVDVTEISRTLGNSPDVLVADNLHPSTVQYAAWVEEMLFVVTELLDR